MFMFLFRKKRSMFILHLEFHCLTMIILTKSSTSYQMNGKGIKYFLTITKWYTQGSFFLWNGSLTMYFWKKGGKKKASEWCLCWKLWKNSVRKLLVLFPRHLQKNITSSKFLSWKKVTSIWLFKKRRSRHLGEEQRCFHRKINKIKRFPLILWAELFTVAELIFLILKCWNSFWVSFSLPFSL